MIIYLPVYPTIVFVWAMPPHGKILSKNVSFNKKFVLKHIGFI